MIDFPDILNRAIEALRSGNIDNPKEAARSMGFEGEDVKVARTRSGEWCISRFHVAGLPGDAGLMRKRVPQDSLVFFFPDGQLPGFDVVDSDLGSNALYTHVKDGKGFIARYERHDFSLGLMVYNSDMKIVSFEVSLGQSMAEIQNRK